MGESESCGGSLPYITTFHCRYSEDCAYVPQDRSAFGINFYFVVSKNIFLVLAQRPTAHGPSCPVAI